LATLVALADFLLFVESLEEEDELESVDLRGAIADWFGCVQLRLSDEMVVWRKDEQPVRQAFL